MPEPLWLVVMASRMDKLPHQELPVSDRARRRTVRSVNRLAMTRRRLIALSLITATGALAASVAGASSSGSTSKGAWTWGDAHPGTTIRSSTDAVVSVLEFSNDVDALSVRELIATGSREGRFQLLFARGSAGEPCFTAITPRVTRGFSCVTSPAETLALMHYTFSGGSRIGSTDWSGLVGIARSDVANVRLRLRNGNEVTLSLNRWRAFSHTASSPDALPYVIMAYRADGTLVEERFIGT